MTTESNQIVLQKHYHDEPLYWADIGFFDTCMIEKAKEELGYYKEHGGRMAEYRLIQRKTIHTLEETVIE